VSNSCFIIAEAGVNHNGEMETAFELAQAALDAGADAVKYQLFIPEALVLDGTPTADYQQRNTGQQSQLQLLQRLALHSEQHAQVKQYCEHIGIQYMCSPFDNNSADYLCNVLQLDTIKIGSGELSNGPMLLQIAQSGKNTVLSTGMSTVADIRCALNILAHGYSRPKSENPLPYTQLLATPPDLSILRNKVVLLHCTTEYPCPETSVNLLAMRDLAQQFELPVGLSDHSEGILASTSAVSLGACVIEKHFTLDKNQNGPDHCASLNPAEFSALVKGIRSVERMLGNGVKQPDPVELQNKKVVRKHIVAACDIKQGELFTEHNLTCKRTPSGISPFSFWELLGKPAGKDYAINEEIRF